MSKTKCPHCGKYSMVYNELLSKYECKRSKCWIERIPKENSKDINRVFGSFIPGMLCTNLPPSLLEIKYRLGKVAVKSGYNILRSFEKSIFNK